MAENVSTNRIKGNPVHLASCIIRGWADMLSLEDPLSYLPRKPVQEFAKRRLIYGPEQSSNGLYVVILGRVKIVTTFDDRLETIGRIVCPDGFFGECALIGSVRRPESAVAIDRVGVMSWTRKEIEIQIDREPHLGIALSQYLVGQCLALQERIESMAALKTPERVMLALVQLAAMLGTPMPDRFVRIGSLTQQTIADFVGTSREIVASQMTRLRRLGLLRYSRQSIDVQTQAIQEVLRKEGISVPHPEEERVQMAAPRNGRDRF